MPKLIRSPNFSIGCKVPFHEKSVQAGGEWLTLAWRASEASDAGTVPANACRSPCGSALVRTRWIPIP